MRVGTDTSVLEVEPGTSAGLTIDIVNTDDVIAGVSASVIGLATEYVSATPAMLPLFPDASGTVRLGLAVPPAHPAGRHPLTVEVVSHGSSKPPDYIDVDMEVAAHPGLRVTAQPRVIRARRSSRFVLELVNTGNVALDVDLAAQDPDRQVQVTFTPDFRRIEPGGTAPILLGIRGPRMFTGAEVDRTVVVQAVARPAVSTRPPVGGGPAGVAAGGPAGVGDGPDDVTGPVPLIPDDATAEHPGGAAGEPAEAPEADAAPFELVRETSVRLRQKPTVSRGLLTVLILLAIVAAWAAIFLLGLGKVFASDPMTKQAPASFFASLNDPDGAKGAAGGAGAGSGGAAPAGALSKSGQVQPGLGGEITGKVVAGTDQQPVGRILVTAYRQTPKGLREMSSAATQTDGTYTLAGLFPTSYYVKFSRSGFRTVWYPNRPAVAGSQRVVAIAQGTTDGIDASVVGFPATISGKVDPGDTVTDVPTRVIARPLLGPKAGQALARATTEPDGTYTLNGLPAPGSYELTFTTTGYQSSTLIDTVSGDDRRLEPTVLLGASAGQISGTVTDNGTPLGGAKVTTTIGGRTFTVGTPTTGQVGHYVLGNLPTPATYIVTVSMADHGSSTQIVDLAAGQSRAGLDVRLSGGTGTVIGKVVGPNGKGLGGATVTVGGAVTSSGAPLRTTALTAGDPGVFAINGLRRGSYTLSVSLDGYATASVPVTLSSGTAPNVTVRLANRLGKISGRITKSGGSTYPGATVTARNGERSWTTTSNSSNGGYLFSDLGPGSYSVTVTAAGMRQQTALVTVHAGRTAHQNLRLGG